MKKAVCLSLLSVVFLFGGCCPKMPAGFEKDKRPGIAKYDTKARVCRSVELNRQMLWEDWDHFWMTEKPNRCSWLRVR